MSGRHEKGHGVRYGCRQHRHALETPPQHGMMGVQLQHNVLHESCSQMFKMPGLHSDWSLKDTNVPPDECWMKQRSRSSVFGESDAVLLTYRRRTACASCGCSIRGTRAAPCRSSS